VIAKTRLKRKRSALAHLGGAGVNGWENGSIEAFLGAASAWAEGSIHGLEFYSKPENPWTRAAQIIHAGKFYE